MVGLVAALAGLALAWQYTSLNDFANVGFVSSVIAQRSEFAPLLAIAAFVVGGLVVFPVLVLIAATAAALGPWMGFVSAATGVLLSALLLFVIGRVLGHVRLQRLLGRRASRIQSRIVGKGVVAVAMIRMVPIAPFSIVNVAAGASKLSLRDFMLGTVLGMAPGIAAMAALGAQIADLARNASWTNALLLGAGDRCLDRGVPRRAVPGDLDGGTKDVTGTIRIMTWNVHGTFNLNPKFDLEGVCSLIRHWAPDVVALQEVDFAGANRRSLCAAGEGRRRSPDRRPVDRHEGWRLRTGPVQPLAFRRASLRCRRVVSGTRAAPGHLRAHIVRCRRRSQGHCDPPRPEHP